MEMNAEKMVRCTIQVQELVFGILGREEGRLRHVRCGNVNCAVLNMEMEINALYSFYLELSF